MKKGERGFWVYVTAADAAEARRLGKTMVERRLAACVNLLGPIKSFYWWKGRVESGKEAALVFKTRKGRLKELIRAIRTLHSYECPCVVALPIMDGHPDFLAWICSETATRGRRGEKA